MKEKQPQQHLFKTTKKIFVLQTAKIKTKLLKKKKHLRKILDNNN